MAEAETQQILTVESDHWGFLGPTFRTKIPATALGDDLYKIKKTDWDATIGPIFDRMNEEVHDRNKIDNKTYRAISEGYMAMEGGQQRVMHLLLQSFAAAANPADIAHYPGTPDTNPWLARIQSFVDAYNGPEQAVLVSGAQLQGLAHIARRAFEYVRENNDVNDAARTFYRDYAQREGVYCSSGLIRALSETTTAAPDG